MQMPPVRLQEKAFQLLLTPGMHKWSARFCIPTHGLQDTQPGEPQGCLLHQGHLRPVSQQSDSRTAWTTQAAGGRACCRRRSNPKVPQENSQVSKQVWQG